MNNVFIYIIQLLNMKFCDFSDFIKTRPKLFVLALNTIRCNTYNNMSK